MCELPACEATATVVVLQVTPQGNLSPTHACEECAVGMDEMDDDIELVDLGAWAVATELSVDPIKVMEVRNMLGKPPYAEVLVHLMANPVK